MNSLLSQIRADLFSGAMSVAKKSWLNVLLVQFIQVILMMLIFVPLFLGVFGSSFFSMFENMNDPVAMQEQSQVIAMQMMSSIRSGFLMMLLGIIALLLISSWTVNLFILITDNYIRGRGQSFMDLFQQSFNKNVFRILGAMVLFVLIGIGIEIAFGLVIGLVGFALNSAFLMGILGLVFLFFVLAFFMRYVLTFPAIVIGKMKATEAMSYSLSKVTWHKAFKYGLIALVGVIGFYIIILLVMIPFGGMMGSSAIAGIALIQIAQILITSFIVALVYAIIVGLYYRYTKSAEDEDQFNVEDHLIADL